MSKREISKEVTISFRATGELKQRLEDMAAKEDRTLTSLITHLLKKGLQGKA